MLLPGIEPVRRALRKPVQPVGVTVRREVASAILRGSDTDGQLVAVGAIRFHEELQFSGIDEQHGVVVGKLPALTVGGPSAAYEPDVGVVTLLAFGLLSRDATNPQFRRQRTEVHREALAIEVYVDRYSDGRKRCALRTVIQRFLDLT